MSVGQWEHNDFLRIRITCQHPLLISAKFLCPPSSTPLQSVNAGRGLSSKGKCASDSQSPMLEAQGNALSLSSRDIWRYCTCSEGFRQNSISEEFTNSAKSQQGESILPRFPWNLQRAPNIRNLLSFLPGHPSGSSTIQVSRALGQPAAKEGCLARGDFTAPTLLSLGCPRHWTISGRKHQRMHRWRTHETQWRGWEIHGSALETTHSASCCTIHFCRISTWLCSALLWQEFSLVSSKLNFFPNHNLLFKPLPSRHPLRTARFPLKSSLCTSVQFQLLSGQGQRFVHPVQPTRNIAGIYKSAKPKLSALEDRWYEQSYSPMSSPWEKNEVKSLCLSI